MKNYSFLNFFIIFAVAGMLIIQMQPTKALADSGTKNYEQVLKQFESKHNWADKETKEFFKFIYYNIPDERKERVLARYGSILDNEQNAVTRQRLIEITNEIMPPAVPVRFKNTLNSEMQKFTSYQDSVKQ